MSGRTHPVATELLRQIAEDLLRQIVDDYLRKIPGLLQGRLGAGALPPGAMISRGAYDPAASYRPGDVVTSGGAAYVAIAASSGQPVTDPASWAPLGGGSAREAIYWDGHALTWGGDGLYFGA